MKIISQIMGGLGNQMFQYSCGRAVANRLNAEYYLDLSWFNDGNRLFMLDSFPNLHYFLNIQKHNSSDNLSLFQKIMHRIVKKNTIKYIQESDYSYWPGIENIQSSVHLSGYWQNEKYFSDIASIIRWEFTFPEFPCSESKKMANTISSSSCPVSIHIRRGDYVENASTNRFHGVCALEYYQKALLLITEKYNKDLQLYLFSDDPDWIKDNFDTQGYSSIIIYIPQHKNAPYHDMHLMSLCQHHIIANSSFSWWGAWLSSRDGMVIAPKRWFSEETRKHHNPVIASWITL